MVIAIARNRIVSDSELVSKCLCMNYKSVFTLVHALLLFLD